MIPILYPAIATSWANNGIGHLRDCIKCEISEERNGAYELEMQYPISGAHYKSIAKDCLIKVKANDTSDLQLFRVYKHSKPINGIVTFYARHLSYDLNGIIVPGVTISGSTATAALSQTLSRAVTAHNFQSWSDAPAISSTNITRPCSARAVMGGQQGSILQMWGGEYEFDNYTVRLWAQRGKQTEVVIEYGKNLTSATQEENLADTYTHVMPYAVQTAGDSETVFYMGDGNSDKLIALQTVVLGHTKVLPLDLSDKFGEGAAITPQALLEKANAWIEANKPELPKVNVKVSFINLAQTLNYAAIAPLQQLNLCDTVTVRFAELGIDATAKVIKTKYDTLAERFIDIEVGDAKSNFAKTIAQQKQDIGNIGAVISQEASRIQKEIDDAVQRATDAITGNSGGKVILHPALHPQELLILQDANDSIETAQKLWRFNAGGLGFSSNGYNGPFGIALTANGEINASAITTGTLTANVIRAGMLQDAVGKNSWNLDTGVLTTDSMVARNIHIESGSVNIKNTSGAATAFMDAEGVGLLDRSGNLRFDYGLSETSGQPVAANITAYGVDLVLGYSDSDTGAGVAPIRISADGLHLAPVQGDLYVTGSIHGDYMGSINPGQIWGVLDTTQIPNLPYSKIINPPWLTSDSTISMSKVVDRSDAGDVTIDIGYSSNWGGELVLKLLVGGSVWRQLAMGATRLNYHNGTSWQTLWTQ